MAALDEWVSNGWLKRHTPSDAELNGLRAIVARELNDGGRSEERRAKNEETLYSLFVLRSSTALLLHH